MGNKGSNTTTQNAYGTTTTAANDEAQRAYEDVMRRATDAANTPYQAYKGQEVAPINAQQQAGFGTLNQTVANNHPLSADDIQKYMNPYTNDVVNATQADFDVQNQRANSTVTGNAAAQGALGGDRVGVAQALTAEGQARAQAPVIAGLRSSAYNSGLGAAQQQQQFGFQSGLQGAQAQVGAGTLEQQNQQAKDTQKMTDFYRARGYDFQVAQWLAGIDTGVGSQMGGTSTNSTHGQTEGPSPNTFAQIAGLGLGALSFANRGGRIEADRARGGGVAGFAGGGLPTPYANDFQSWVPQTGLTAGHGAPSPPQVHAPEAPKDQSMSPEQIMKGVGGLGKAFGNSKYGDATSDYAQDLADGDAGSFSTYFARGGGVKRYASGGSPGGGLPWLDDASAGWYAPDLIPTVAGFGASTPAVQSRSEEPADIPGQFRLDEQAHRDWQGRVDRDTGRARTNAAIQQGEPPPELQPAPKGEVMLAQNDNGATDPGLGPRGNPRPLSAQEDMANAIHDGTVPAGEDSALGYAPEPRRGVGAPRPSPAPPAPDQQQPEGSGGILGGLGIHLTPELRQGLLQAGLAMMATKRGGPGSFLGAAGEGGLRGVAGYNASVQAQQEADQQQFKNQMAVDELGMKHETQDQKRREAPILPNGQINPAWKAMKDYETKDRWAPIGSLMTQAGDVHPLAMNASTGDVRDAVTGKPPEATDKVKTKDDKSNPTIVGGIVNGISSGHQPPDLKGLYGNSAAVRAGLEEKGFDLAKAQMEWKRAEKQIATLNGPQMTRFVGLADSVNSTIDEVRNLSKELKNSGIPKLNQLALTEASQLEGNSPRGKLAARYVGAVNTLKEEFANLANGGYAPTEPAWKLANEQINGNFGVEQLGASLDEIQRLIRYRVNAIPGLSTLGAGAENRYTGQKQHELMPEGAPAPATTAPAATPAKTLVRTGTQNSTGKTIFEYSDGTREVK